MTSLVIAENVDYARELCAGARTLSDKVVLVSFGAGSWTSMADECRHVIVPEDRILDDAYGVVNRIADEVDPSVVLAESTVGILSLVGRLGAHMKTSVITDVLNIEEDAATSLYFGGVGQRVTRSKGATGIFTVNQGVFDGSEATGSDSIVEVEFESPQKAVRRLASEDLPKADVNLTAAEVVVCAGRGFAQQEDLDLARELCAKTGGELGCSRPLAEGVDWMPREAYVGVSGLTLTPKVYISCGISGQMQHMIGINRAKTIFAINKDKNAPIFKQCDYGLVGDIKDVLPALTAVL